MTNDDDKNTNNRRNNNKGQEEELFLIVSRFRNIAISKLEKMASEVEKSDDLDRNSNNNGNKVFVMGEEETRVFTQMHGMGLKEGIAASIFSFLLLRKGPVYIGRWVLKRRQQPNTSATAASSGGYQLSNPNNIMAGTSSSSLSANPFKTTADTAASNPHQFPRSRNIVLRSIWFMFDSVLSLMVGASVSMACTDTVKIRQQVAELPLLPGRSLTSDALCGDIVAELQRLQREQSPVLERLNKQANITSSITTSNSNNNDISPAAFYMQGIITFSENCQRRAFQERKIRQENGLGRNDVVTIPSPGVPKDGPRLIVKRKNTDDNSLFEGEGEEEVIVVENSMLFQEGKGDVVYTDSTDDDWASNFVLDQEETDNSNDRRKKP